jgi:diacylglycerol kinase family enzyme
MPPVPVIVNPRSGSSRSVEEIQRLFREAGGEADVRVTQGSPNDLAHEIARDKPPLIVAAGGDGTVSAVASALVGTPIPLAVLPVGTLNHFARDIGVPEDAAAAVRIALGGKTRAVDVGEVNGRLFVNNSSIGLYPTMVRLREKQQRRLGRSKWQAMLWAMHAVLRSHPFLDLTLTLDGVEHHRRTPFVFVGNNVYDMHGFTIGLRERVDGGMLSVYIAHRGGRLGLVLLALRALFGIIDKDFEGTAVSRLRIESRHTRLLVATDGEVDAMDLPLMFRIRPRALQVRVP